MYFKATVESESADVSGSHAAFLDLLTPMVPGLDQLDLVVLDRVLSALV